GEDATVQRVERIPVCEPDHPARIKDRRLANMRAVMPRRDFELQPEPTGDLHLGSEPEQSSGLETLDAPEVDGVADLQVDVIAPTAPQAHAAAGRVEQTAEQPEPVRGVPAGRSADPLDRNEGLTGPPIDSNRAAEDTPVANAGAAPV